MPDDVFQNGKRIPQKALALCIRDRDEIRIHKSVMRALSNPVLIHFWWCEREKILLVGAANEITPMSIPIPERCQCHNNGVRFVNRKLLKEIRNLAGWKDGTAHQLPGEYIPDIKMVAFRTSDSNIKVAENDQVSKRNL